MVNKAKGKATRILILFICFLFLCCKESPFDREQKMINQYDKEFLRIKGDSALFVSKETVANFFMQDSDMFELKNVKVNDNVCFFDKDGNIVYQAICRDIKGSLIYLECLNFDTKENYIITITYSDYSKIKELKKFEVEDVKVFRDK